VTQWALDRVATLRRQAEGAGGSDEAIQASADDAWSAIEAVAFNLYLATDLLEDKRGGIREATDEQRRTLLSEAGDLLEQLAGSEHPQLIHHMAEIACGLAYLDVEGCVHLVWLALGGNGVPGLAHYEELVAKPVFGLFEEVLADHRQLIAEDGEFARQLVGILDGFVWAGWTQAHALVLDLELALR
jgi:hypothetical protein